MVLSAELGASPPGLPPTSSSALSLQALVADGQRLLPWFAQARLGREAGPSCRAVWLGSRSAGWPGPWQAGPRDPRGLPPISRWTWGGGVAPQAWGALDASRALLSVPKARVGVSAAERGGDGRNQKPLGGIQAGFHIYTYTHVHTYTSINGYFHFAKNLYIPCMIIYIHIPYVLYIPYLHICISTNM